MATPRRIHQSLLTPPFFLGVPLEALFAEVLFLLAGFSVFGLSKVFVVYAALTLTLAHPLLCRLTRREPLALRLLAASLAYSRFYPARGTLKPFRPILPKPCLPRRI